MGRKRIYATQEEAAQRNRERAANRSREQSASVKEIGPLPEVENPKRKANAGTSLYEFMMTYGGKDAGLSYTFTAPFCEEQMYMIQVLDDVLKNGGEVPLCIFRGGCKTTFCEWGLLWAALYGYQRFGLVVAASCGMSRKIIANIKRMLQDNELLHADFPEVCYPIQKLERITQRATAQVLNGEPTEMIFTTDSLRFPKVRGSKASQAIIQGVGAESSFRGLRDGTQRPTVVLIDDPQTNASANSQTQTDARWENITTSMKGLAGIGTELAMVATVTVIRKGDLAEKILERWNGKRFGILRSMPKNMDAWEEYNEMRQRTTREVTSIAERNRLVNEYYLANRDILDEGAEATWESHYSRSEVSAIQHAMNLYFFDKRAFWSEYMNLPPDDEKDAENLTLDQLEAKIRKDLPKGVAPYECERITAGIDIQKDCLFWVVTAWCDDFSGHILDYGRYPKGTATMEHICKNGAGLEEQVETCLTELGEILLKRTFRRDGNGEELKIDKIIVDANWGLVTTNVKKVCRRFPREMMEPTFGWGKGPESRFMPRKKKPGETRGPEWYKLPMRSECRSYTYNTNWWKSFVRCRIQAGIHGKSTLTFYGADEIAHAKLFQHFLGETSSKLSGQYGTMDKWVLRPGEPNHWWDCLVMSAVGASAEKIQIPSYTEAGAVTASVSNSGQNDVGRRWIEL